jgi:hypothetical protein
MARPDNIAIDVKGAVAKWLPAILVAATTRLLCRASLRVHVFTQFLNMPNTEI